MSWDVTRAMEELENYPPNQKINWSEVAHRYQIPNRNAGQVLKEMAKKHGINTLSLERSANTCTTPRIRKSKLRLPGREISIPCLPTVNTVKEEKKQLILSGELHIGEPCATFQLTKSIITEDGNTEIRSVTICGRKIQLTDLRKALLKKQESYMHVFSNNKIQNMSKQDLCEQLSLLQHQVSPNATLEELQHSLSTLQRRRTLAIWHDHSTILQTGYILFAVWVLYDPAVFYTQEEWKIQHRGQVQTYIQSLVEEPMIYMLAPSSSSPADQLALIGDRIECLQELSQPITASNGEQIHDQLRFFCGDKPAQQFERGTQIGGTYKCGGCGKRHNG